MTQKQRILWLGLALAGTVVLLYAPVGGYDFLLHDDDVYVVDNPWVADGLTADGVAWAFKTRHAANWHPLTWLSHMLDVELFGLEPGWHHRINVLLHAASAALTLLVFHLMTGAVSLAGSIDLVKERGGAIGSLIAFPLRRVVGFWGAFVILIAITTLGVLVLTRTTVRDIGSTLLAAVSGLRGLGDRRRRRRPKVEVRSLPDAAVPPLRVVKPTVQDPPPPRPTPTVAPARRPSPRPRDAVPQTRTPPQPPGGVWTRSQLPRVAPWCRPG